MSHARSQFTLPPVSGVAVVITIEATGDPGTDPAEVRAVMNDAADSIEELFLGDEDDDVDGLTAD
jgi:hypothetical protein